MSAPDSELPDASAATPRRTRQLIASGAALLAVAATIAFIIGRNPSEPRRTADKTRGESVIPGASTEPPVIEDWPDTPGEDETNTPAAEKPGAPKTVAASAGTSPEKQSSPNRQGAPEGQAVASANPPAAAPGPDDATRSNAAGISAPDKSSPEPAAVGSRFAGTDRGEKPRASTAAPAEIASGVPSGHAAPRPETARNTTALTKPPAGAALPAFKKPRSSRTGLVAQTTELVKEDQFAAASGAVPVAAAKTPARRAVVTQRAAIACADHLTASLRSARGITATQMVRLPANSETSNRAVWHHDDHPQSEAETRAFGLVIEECDPAARAALARATPAPAVSTTPDGIPLRTDIPAGTSPLDKHGPDKPLWQRP